MGADVLEGIGVFVRVGIGVLVEGIGVLVGGTGVFVGTRVGVSDGIGVRVLVGDGVDVPVGFNVRVAVGVGGLGVLLGRSVLVGVRVNVGDKVAVKDGVNVAVSEADNVGEGWVEDGVREMVAVIVGVNVGPVTGRRSVSVTGRGDGLKAAVGKSPLPFITRKSLERYCAVPPENTYGNPKPRIHTKRKTRDKA
ncbi:MAG: hypothetical protein HXY35_12065 [Chloroflexi bacterium]|nr:hypothetical protein [Chloroflexota bacterium]